MYDNTDSRVRDSAARAEKLIVAAAVCVALYWLLWSGILWFRYHPHLPWRDLFLVLGDILQWSDEPVRLATMGQWFEPHYGAHRIAVLRLLLWLDHSMLAGQNHLIYLAGWSSLLLILAVFCRAAAQYFREATATLLLAALAMAWLFSPSHLWNLINPVNISWHIMLACSLSAFYLLLGKTRALDWWDWALAYTLCAVAAFANFGGVVAWLLLPLLACQVQVRAFFPTLLLSVLLAWAYASGMSSDAAQATQWDLGSAEVVEQIRGEARAALAANTPWFILTRTIRFLGWPLSGDWPGVAAVLSIASVLVLAAFFSQALLLRLRSQARVHHWLEFCILGAGLCLGIVLATQWGRVMVHPNHVHGPSFERYQSIVVVYWLCISGLLLGLRPRLPAASALLYTVVLIITWILLLPNGNYLKQEIQSAEAAARLFARGQRTPAGQPPPTVGSRFTPEFVFSFDDYFDERRLSYRALPALPVGMDAVETCAESLVESSANASPSAALTVTARLPAPAVWLSRAILVYTGEAIVGQLSPVHRGDYTAQSLLEPRHGRWQGVVAVAGEQADGDRIEQELTLVVQGILGARPWCTLTLARAG